MFQGRFKTVVDEKPYILAICRYVDLTPVQAHMVKRPRNWAWSSFRTHTALVAPPAWLDSRALYRRSAAKLLAHYFRQADRNFAIELGYRDGGHYRAVGIEK